MLTREKNLHTYFNRVYPNYVDYLIDSFVWLHGGSRLQEMFPQQTHEY